MELGLPRLHRPREQEDEREDGRGWGHLTRPEGQITGVVGVHGGSAGRELVQHAHALRTNGH